MRMRSRGVTLIEIIVASMVMVMVLSAIYRIFRSSAGVMQAGMWTTNAQNEVRNTLTFLSGEISRAGAFATVTETGVTPDPDPKYQLYFKRGTIDKDFSGVILKFYQCRTAINLPPTPDPGGRVFCEVKKEQGNLIINKTLEAGSSTEKLFSEKVLLSDVAEIKMESQVAAVGEQMAKALLTIVITVADPKKTSRLATSETKAKVDVETVEL